MYKTEGQVDSNFMKPEIDEIKTERDKCAVWEKTREICACVK